MTVGEERCIAEALAVLAVSRRDETAWEKLYRQSWPFVKAIVYRRLGGVDGLVEDATQEVFIRLLRSCPFPQLTSPDAFRGYLWRVSDNVARTYRRRIISRHESALPSEETSLAGDATSGRSLPDEIEVAQLLQDVWRGLSGAERTVLRMLVQGYSTGEIADKLAISYGAAAIRLMRLRIKLHKSFVFKGIMAAESS